MVQENEIQRDVYKAALIIIGNEILAGRTQDTNTQWIAERLTSHGIILKEVRIIADEEDVIIKTVREIHGDFDYVFTTGGIGPTHDDITAASIAKAFDKELVRNEDAYRMLEEHYGIDDITPSRLKMSFIPEGSALIPNPVTAAPGFKIENVCVMAGVPRIMQAMLDHILGMIQAGKPVLSNTVTCNLSESTVAQDLSDMQERYPDIQIGSYPHYRGGVLGLSLVVRGTDKDQIEQATSELIDLVESHGDEPRALSLRALSDQKD